MHFSWLYISFYEGLILMNLKEKMGSILTPKSVFLFDQIPTTSIGKPDRRTAAEVARKLGASNE